MKPFPTARSPEVEPIKKRPAMIAQGPSAVAKPYTSPPVAMMTNETRKMILGE